MPTTTNDSYYANTNNQSPLTNVFSSLSPNLCRPPAPTVSITAPTNNTQVTAGTNLTVTASASATVGLVLKQVQFFQGTTSMGIVTQSPYQVSWPNTAGNASWLPKPATRCVPG